MILFNLCFLACRELRRLHSENFGGSLGGIGSKVARRNAGRLWRIRISRPAMPTARNKGNNKINTPRLMSMKAIDIRDFIPAFEIAL